MSCYLLDHVHTNKIAHKEIIEKVWNLNTGALVSYMQVCHCVTLA